MRFTYSEMWWFTSRELRVAFVLMFLARLAYFRVLSVSSKDDEAPLGLHGGFTGPGRIGEGSSERAVSAEGLG